eukprot:scaffold6931_cov119-Isochrysis_galbana.AAC.13
MAAGAIDALGGRGVLLPLDRSRRWSMALGARGRAPGAQRIWAGGGRVVHQINHAQGTRYKGVGPLFLLWAEQQRTQLELELASASSKHAA